MILNTAHESIFTLSCKSDLILNYKTKKYYRRISEAIRKYNREENYILKVMRKYGHDTNDSYKSYQKLKSNNFAIFFFQIDF